MPKWRIGWANERSNCGSRSTIRCRRWEAYGALLDEAAKAEATSDRIAALYDGVLPGLIERYRAYLAATDPILDEPSFVIIERIVRDLDRQRNEAAELRRETGSI